MRKRTPEEIDRILKKGGWLAGRGILFWTFVPIICFSLILYGLYCLFQKIYPIMQAIF